MLMIWLVKMMIETIPSHWFIYVDDTKGKIQTEELEAFTTHLNTTGRRGLRTETSASRSTENPRTHMTNSLIHTIRRALNICGNPDWYRSTTASLSLTCLEGLSWVLTFQYTSNAPHTQKLATTSGQDSALHQHIKETGYLLEDSHVGVSGREDGWFERTVKEDTHVKLEKPSFNRGGGLRLVLSPTYNPVLHSLHQQRKCSHLHTGACDSSPCDLADKGDAQTVKPGQRPCKQLLGDHPDH